MPKVYIVQSDYTYDKMFKGQGWEVVNNPHDADLIQFTGGEDVDPALYYEEKHPRTYSNPERDSSESHLIHQFVNQVPLAGICRGGQLLNVMGGGTMWQHVNGHMGTHKANYLEEDYFVTSDHHQMMRPNTLGEVLVTASRSTFKETALIRLEDEGDDVEAVFYPHMKALCFQPHPEYVDHDHDCQILYFTLLKTYLGFPYEI